MKTVAERGDYIKPVMEEMIPTLPKAGECGVPFSFFGSILVMMGLHPLAG